MTADGSQDVSLCSCTSDHTPRKRSRFKPSPVRVEQEVAYELFHHGEPVGYYKADLVVESQVIVETKTGLTLDPLGRIQLLNYLSAARLTLGLLIHFGPTGARVKRMVATGARAVAPREPH
jgi:GxxExxY protein